MVSVLFAERSETDTFLFFLGVALLGVTLVGVLAKVPFLGVPFFGVAFVGVVGAMDSAIGRECGDCKRMRWVW